MQRYQFGRQIAEEVAAKIPAFIERKRAEIYVNRGNVEIEQASIRVRTREIRIEVETAIEALVPKGASDIAQIVGDDPTWLELDIDDGDVALEFRVALRKTIIGWVVEEIAGDVKECINTQFEGLTLEGIVEELRLPIEAVERFDPRLAATVREEIEDQLRMRRPVLRNLMDALAPMQDLLVHESKCGEPDLAVPARTVMELIEGAAMNIGRIEHQHTLSAPSGPRR